MSYSLEQLQDLTARHGRDGLNPILDTLSQDDIKALLTEGIQRRDMMRQQEQIAFYKPVSERARQIHLATEKEVLVTGGNRSSKTDTILADTIICMTGIIPFALKDTYPAEKIRCPMRVRVTCESLTNTWEPVIKPKLMWNKWNGRGAPGGRWGHWGWVPRRFLIHGKWEDSWSEKNRTLTLTCGCTMQIMSYDQEAGDFSGSSLHRAIHDEPPPADIYRENLIRTMDVQGQVYSGFTPSDDPGKALRGSWIYELYERGLAGPGKDADFRSISLYTEENQVLDPAEIQKIAKGLTAAEKEVRLRGGFMHLSGRIYPQYTDVERSWCFACNDVTIIQKSVLTGSVAVCANCVSDRVTKYQNFIEPDQRWLTYPIVFVIDPHPRKPNMMAWIACGPADDFCMIHNLEVDGEPETVRDHVLLYERNNNLFVAARLIDPNMAESPAHSAGRRHISVRDEFDAVGLRCSLADDSFQVGMKKLRSLIKPDPRTLTPRMFIFNTCHFPNKQMKNYVWAEWSSQGNAEKDPKATPRAKDDDYPTILRYFANQGYAFSSLHSGMKPRKSTRKERTGAYA